MSLLEVICIIRCRCHTGPCVCDQQIFTSIISDIRLSTLLHADIAAAWSGQLILDILIFLFTLIRSLRIRKQVTRSIADILLRDGAPVELALSTATYTNESLGSLYFGCVFVWGKPMATDKMLSFQDNVWSQRCECDYAISELSSHVPPSL